MEKFSGINEGLTALLQQFQQIFGELPPPTKGQALVQMDIKLKKEFENCHIRSKCWNMPKIEQDEIELQDNEMLKAGLAEEYLGEDFPRFCSPTLLVDKDKGKAKRMCIDYRKLNQRTQIHAGSLPHMENAVETLCRFKYKCKMDMRSGFWQVSLSKEAKDLCAFILPSGRILKPTVMPFGLTNAPAIFQELMEKVVAQAKMKKEDLFVQGKAHLAAFFDDSSIGANSLEDCLKVLKVWFEVCQENNLRIKLSKCEFLKETLEYLGFEVGHKVWKPSSKKVEALQKAKITNLKSLQSFLGACNFCRRHVKNFTFSSAILTELTKKNVPWNWTEEHERAFLELKSKLANVSGLGVPNIEGEIVLVTDASNIGGGGSLFQWQPPASGATLGVQKDGSLKHTFGEKTKLVPLGHFNWKWSPTRCNYPTYEQELLSGILTISSQCRILGHLPIVWLCDQEATSSFARGPP